MRKANISFIDVLPALVNGNIDDVLKNSKLFLSKIKAEYIAEEEKILFESLVSATGKGVRLDEDVLVVFLKAKKIPEKESLSTLRKLASAKNKEIDFSKFTYIVSALEQRIKRFHLENSLLAASIALEGSYFDEESKITYSGVDGALEVLSIGSVKSFTAGVDKFPQGNILDEKEEILNEYNDIAVKGIFDGVKTGFATVDRAISGVQRGELLLLGAATGEGKSMACTNMAWYNAIVEGKNVAIFTAETLRKQYRRRLLARHSCLAKFGLDYGLPMNNIKRGSLSKEEYDKFLEVVEDLTSNPNYGYCNVFQITEGATIREIRMESEIVDAEVGLDAVYIDYLSLLSSIRKRAKRQEEVNDILKDAKSLAVTFRGGKGLSVISAHQMSSQAREKVQPVEGKYYSIRDFADTSEAGKSADLAFALLRTKELESQKEVALGGLKVRDDGIFPIFRLMENYPAAALFDIASEGEVGI